MGPQYRRSFSRSRMPLGAAPYDMSPSLRIAVVLNEPHSLASMGGMRTPSPGAEFWGISLDPASARSGRGSVHAARGTAGLAWGGRGRGNGSGTATTASAPRGQAQSVMPASAPTAAPAPSGATASQHTARVPSMERSGSFYKYSAFYSGMDVGVTPPISTGFGSGGGGLSVTPRPNELLSTATQQEWCVSHVCCNA